MNRISGFDKLAHELNEAQRAINSVDEELGTVSFNPNDAASIEAAIQQVELIVDERLSAYSSNPIIGPLMIGLKEKYREGIIERAAAARLEEGHE